MPLCYTSLDVSQGSYLKYLLPTVFTLMYLLRRHTCRQSHVDGEEVLPKKKVSIIDYSIMYYSYVDDSPMALRYPIFATYLRCIPRHQIKAFRNMHGRAHCLPKMYLLWRHTWRQSHVDGEECPSK